MRKSFKQQQDYFIVNILGISSNQRLQFQQKKSNFAFNYNFFGGLRATIELKCKNLV